MGIISIKNLVHRFSKYGDNGEEIGEKTALEQVSLDIEKGSFVAILGHNGSGKSTLAKHLNALLLPTEGTVYISDKLSSDEKNLWKIRQSTGMVFQNPDNQIVANVVEEDVGFGPENMGVPTEEIWKRVNESLKAVGMEAYRMQSPNKLSGGQKQRVAIAGIMAMKPQIIVMDEPTAMLDPSGRKEVLDTVHELNKKEKNYLLSTLFKGYVIQCAICSVLIFGGTFLLGIMAEEILRKYVLYYYLYYRTVYLYIVAVIVWGGCIIYMTYLLLKKVVAYVYEVQAATGKMFDQNVSYIEMSPELSEIAANINQLKQEAESNARLAKENEQRKNDLIMYLAHDLKTPLSSVIGYLTLLRDESQISKELREKYLSITLGKAERLEDLINEFFEITRFNIYDITLQYTKINLTRLLEQLVYEFKPMLKSKNLQCNLCVDDDIMLRCDADKIQRVFDNLLRNAVIYSFENTDITISAQCQEDTVSIIFCNHGDTLPEEKLNRIFEQFYRLDAARSTSSGGAGLGLAIAKQIVELHNGTIVAESQEDQNKFSITLPLA